MFVFTFREHIWPHIPYGSGTADFTISGGDVSVSLKCDADQEPNGVKPSLVVDSCNVSIDDISVNMHGSILDWLYNIILKSFKGNIKKMIASAVSTALTNAINSRVDSMLASLTYKYNLGNWGILDYSVTGDCVFDKSSQTFYFPFKAEVYGVNSSAEANLPRAPMNFSSTLGGRDAEAILDLFALNSGLLVLFDSKSFSYTITNAMLPSQLPVQLNTSFWTEILPVLSNSFPDTLMQAIVTLGSAPILSTTADGLAQANGDLLLNFEGIYLVILYCIKFSFTEVWS